MTLVHAVVEKNTNIVMGRLRLMFQVQSLKFLVDSSQLKVFSFQFLVDSSQSAVPSQQFSVEKTVIHYKLRTLKLSFFIVFLLLSYNSFSQSNNITINRDTLVDILVQQHIKYNLSQDYKSGYRIQLMASPNRTKVGNEKARFSRLFPDTKTYIDYQQPYFKLRVGNFKDQYQAYKFLEEIKASFRGAFPVQDKIN